jgi:hypothetical protein
MENIEDGNTQKDFGHKNHGATSLTNWDQMITLISQGFFVNLLL